MLRISRAAVGQGIIARSLTSRVRQNAGGEHLRAVKSRSPSRRAACAWLATIGWLAGSALADEPRPSAPQSGHGETVVARVNAEPIFRGEVLLELNRITSSAEANENSRETLQAQILRQLVDRQLVVEHLSRNRLGASQQDVDFELRRLTQRLAQRGGKSLDDYLAERGLPIEALRRRLAWQLGWPRYLQRHLSEEQLRQHFERHRRDYDGTQMRVAHILLRVSNGEGTAGGGDPLPMALSRAKAIRHEIETGAVTFAEAARTHSEAPTAADGGNLGVISRHQPMSEDFSRAAFALMAGEISEPTVTKFGVHLIHCQEVTPGKLGWHDVQEQLQKDVALQVFQELASDARQGARIEFTGNMPYFDPASGALVPALSPR